MFEKKSCGEQSWSSLARLLKAFTERKKSSRKKSVDEEDEYDWNQSAVGGVVHARMDERGV